MIGLAVLFSRKPKWSASPPLTHFATAASANIMVAILIRQDYIVNACFKFAWLVPITAPLRLRRILAKVYEYGGVHSGAAVSSVVWFILLTVFLTQQYATSHLTNTSLLTTTYVLLTILLVLCITAYPAFRFQSHNTFEHIHRWGGWTSLALFWAELILFSHTLSMSSISSTSLGMILIKLPAFYFLAISTLHTILPWLRLRRLPVVAEKLSPHAIRLHFSMPVPLFVGLRIAESPLGEWHSFACIPSRFPTSSSSSTTSKHAPGGSVLISAAGDWTRATIAYPRPYYYVKGIPVTGVLCMARLFRSVVIVTTGSGIGPCLAVMQDIPKTRVRLIWSASAPQRTYGEGIIASVLETDKRALIWDTKIRGRPDLVALAWEVFWERRGDEQRGAEAVFVISNPALTRKVVYGMESRGVPAFGPIWDS